MSEFVGKHVIVTGANSGIGLATALAFADSGAVVTAVDIASDKMDACLGRFGASVRMHIADLRAPEAAREIAAVSQGKIDVLANVAGVMDGFVPVGELDDDSWNTVMDINLGAPMRLMREAIPAMKAAGGGAIINVASIASSRGAVAGAAYTASKHGLVGLTRHAAVMYAKDGIRANAIAPGPISTAIDISYRSDLARDRIAPLQHAVMNLLIDTPAEAGLLARQIVWLAGRDARNISGAVINSDFGWCAV